MSKYQIDEVAKKSGLTKRTIRYYEEIGLLFPAERTDGGFRIYTEKHIERLKQIIDTREVLGISLQEVQEFVEIREEVENHLFEIKQTKDETIKHQKLLTFIDVLEKQRTMVDDKLKKLTEIKKDTDYYYHRVSEAIKKYEKGN